MQTSLDLIDRLHYDRLNRVKTIRAELAVGNPPLREFTTSTYDEDRSGFANVGGLTTLVNPAATTG